MRKEATTAIVALLLMSVVFAVSPATAQYGEWSSDPPMSVAGMIWDPISQQWTQGLLYDGSAWYVKLYGSQTVRFEVRNVDATGSESGPAVDRDTYSSAYYVYEEDSQPICLWQITRPGYPPIGSYNTVSGTSPQLNPGVGKCL